MSQYTVFLDPDGNVTAADGVVHCVGATTAFFPVGGGQRSLIPASVGDPTAQRRIGPATSFHGGSGRNYIVSNGPADPNLPRGYFKPRIPDEWSGPKGAFIIRNSGTGELSLNDGTDVLASGGGIGGLAGSADAGTFPVLTWTLESVIGDIRTFRGVEDTGILLIHDTDSGNASIVYDGSFDQIALRAAIDDESAAGVYAASTDGQDDFNGGSPWNYTATDSSLSGTLTATAYGETTYNGGSPFTLDIAAESTLPPWPNAPVEFTPYAGTAQGGLYDPTGWQSWQSQADPDWTVTLDGTGAGELSDGTDIVATRAADADRLYDPGGGLWVATPYGETTHNGGDPWAGEAVRTFATPIAGKLYVEVTLDGSNEVTAAAGPFFGSSLPANTSTLKVYILFESDGAGSTRQVWEGPINWTP